MKLTKALNPKAYADESRTISARVTTETQRQMRELAVANDMSVSKLLVKVIESYVTKNY
ncbi:UNVERIFIED_ORG: hypothetical protein BDU10_3468 [Burkholderia sp. CF145]